MTKLERSKALNQSNSHDIDRDLVENRSRALMKDVVLRAPQAGRMVWKRSGSGQV